MINILLIDDDNDIRETFLESASDEKFATEFSPSVANSVENGLNALKGENVDIAIVDMKFGSDDSKGNEFINAVRDAGMRIPVFIYTGTPDAICVECFRRYIKDQRNINDILQECVDLNHMGLLNIMGRRGLIESCLKQIFYNNLLESSKDPKWIEYANENSERTEKALLRYTLNHLKSMLDDNDDEEFLPEEMYISPACDDRLRTGSILKCRRGKSLMVVISPACDIAVHGSDGMKAERIQLLEIDGFDDTLKKFIKRKNSVEVNEDIKRRLYRNSLCLFYHFLPKTLKFEGGFVNFRKIHSMRPRHVMKYFENTKILVSESFCKDLVSRYSSYYGRQGQPVLKMT